jgi:diadenosine tetraphosphate (Ap4A) HIT family hydrolase
MNKDCQFCESDAFDRTLTQRKQWGSEWFSVYTDTSPIVPSHRLVIPHEHITAFSLLDQRKLLEVSLLFHRHEVSQTEQLRTMIFEHGILDEETSGCGISHAHWHVVDISEQDVCRFRDHVGSSAKILAKCSPTKLCSCKQSYLFLWDTSEELGFVFNGHKSPSQFLRKMLAEVVGASEWDWRLVTKNTTYV